MAENVYLPDAGIKTSIRDEIIKMFSWDREKAASAFQLAMEALRTHMSNAQISTEEQRTIVDTFQQIVTP